MNASLSLNPHPPNTQHPDVNPLCKEACVKSRWGKVAQVFQLYVGDCVFVSNKNTVTYNFSATPRKWRLDNRDASPLAAASLFFFLFALKGPDSRQTNSSVLLVTSSSFFIAGINTALAQKHATLGSARTQNLVACEKWRKCCKPRCNNRRLRRASSNRDRLVYLWNPKWGSSPTTCSKQHVTVLTLIKEHHLENVISLNSVKSGDGAHLHLVSWLPFGKQKAKRLSEVPGRAGGYQ